MKKLEAIVRRSQLNDVLDALSPFGLNLVLVMEAQGYKKDPMDEGTNMEGSYRKDGFDRVQVDALVHDKYVEELITSITEAARTGIPGDGRITVMDVNNVTLVSTGDASVVV